MSGCPHLCVPEIWLWGCIKHSCSHYPLFCKLNMHINTTNTLPNDISLHLSNLQSVLCNEFENKSLPDSDLI